MKIFKSLRYLSLKTLYKEKMGGYNLNELAGKIKPFIEQKKREIAEEFKTGREKLKDIPGTNYKLGLHHLRMGNFNDAIFRFRMVTFLVPEKAEAHYYLGKSYIMNGDLDAAKAELEKALSLKPDFPEVKYIMDKINFPESIEVIPGDMLQEHIAWRKDPTDEERQLKEERDRALVTILLSNILDKNPNLEVLDLGCGSGDRGKLLRGREVVRKITGVDISDKEIQEAMQQVAFNEPIYDSLSNTLISSYLAANTEKFDVVMAGDVFSYQGKLDEIFTNIFRALKKDGFFAAILKREDIESGYKLDVARDKFMHSNQYFQEILEKNNFSVLDKKEKNIGGEYSIIIAKAN